MDNTTTAVLFNDKGDVYLEWLNDKFAATKLGGIIFIGIMMVIGIIGNLHVLYIYALKFKRSTHRIYILCLAMVDTVTCCIGMPFVIVDLQNPLLFRAIAVCKILRFLNYFMCSTSAILLVVIAVDRYKNICHPFEVQMTERRAKIACGISILIGLILSWPAPILYGASTVGTKMISSYLHIEVKANITGTQCFTVDKFFGTPYQTIFNIVLIGIILILTTVLGVLYSLICRAVIQQAQNFQKMTKSINNGLKTTAGQIYKNEFPKISPEHTSSSADSRSTLSDGFVRHPEKKNRNLW
ncbi:hypothetical protein KUTeg_000504 [Tegillarca granosa]|uniref:G-protein coupled receptors family 1 profile domain-containing protein n=1 Tax=Tegillarca granosa TaxID=220873 RepID=A0ABQ9G226_TEGGR|nr:hypothetical protein KUTeg_000504 [Tegillarca granosa]